MKPAHGESPGDPSRQSFLASMGQMFRRLLEMHGVDAVRIAKDADVDLAVIPAPGERIEVDKIDAILRLAIPLIRDPAFGLRAAHCWHPSELGVLGYAWLSSSTLRTGLERAVRPTALMWRRAARFEPGCSGRCGTRASSASAA